MPLTELQQVNAIIGLSMKIDKWPSTLIDLGYSLDRIELSFEVPHRTEPGRSVAVNPDLLFVQDDSNYSLLVELKSGGFEDFEQLDRYMTVTPEEIYKYGRASLDPGKIAGHQIGVMQIVNEDRLEEFHRRCL